MKYKYLICSLTLLLAPSRLMSGVFIVVHGTWANAAMWHLPGGDFFDILEQKARRLGHKVITYTWSGNLDEEHRLAAGKALAKLIRSYPYKTEFYIIAHSHGSNVAIMASHELAKVEHNRHRMKLFYALGTPVDHHKYMPDMDIIGHFYNLFSLNDFVQPVLGLFYRTYPNHERIANIRIMVNGKEPDHCTIHNPILARWIPNLHEMLINNECSPVFTFETPGIIDFYDTAKPRYMLDLEQEALLQKDWSLRERMLALFRKQALEIRSATTTQPELVSPSS